VIFGQEPVPGVRRHLSFEEDVTTSLPVALSVFMRLVNDQHPCECDDFKMPSALMFSQYVETLSIDDNLVLALGPNSRVSWHLITR
jgi:hypothetical protein